MSNVSEKNHGKIVQVMGPVVDVEFENNDLPFIKDALDTAKVNVWSWKWHSISATIPSAVLC